MPKCNSIFKINLQSCTYKNCKKCYQGFPFICIYHLYKLINNERNYLKTFPSKETDQKSILIYNVNTDLLISTCTKIFNHIDF